MNMSSTGKFFKIVGLSTVIALAGGVYTSSALETSYTVQQDAIPELVPFLILKLYYDLYCW